MPLPKKLNNTPITDILALIGITHKRDEFTDTDRAHKLWRKDGTLIGRYDAFECVTKYDELLAISKKKDSHHAIS